MSLREASVDLPAASRVRSRPAATASASASTSASLRPRTHGPIRQAFKSAFSRFAAAPEGSDAQASKSIFLKEASLYTCFLLAGWVDATPGALLPAIREHWNLSFVLVSMLFVGTFVGCIIAAASISPLMDRFGFGKIISVAAALGLIFPVVFLTMPPFPVLIVAMMFSGMSNSSLDALVNVWISQRPRSDVRLGVVHFLYGLGALSSPLAAIPFLHEGRKGIAFQYFFCVSLALALVVLTLVTVAFKLQRDELVEGPAQQLASDDASIELQPRTATQVSDAGDDKDKVVPPTPGSSSHTPLELMPIPAPMPVPEDTRSGLYKLRAVVKQQKVQLLALFTMIYVGCEVTVGGWTSTFLIEVRNQETSANVLVSGFWAGIAFGRILLIPLTAWLGDEVASLVYLVCAVGLQLLVWLVPNIIANAVALALLGIFLGPAFPIMIRVASKTIRPRAHLTAAISFISSFAAAGMALLPLLVGLASQAAPQGIKVLPPILVGLLAAQVGLWTLTNRSHFKQRFFSRGADGGAVDPDEDRLD